MCLLDFASQTKLLPVKLHQRTRPPWRSSAYSWTSLSTHCRSHRASWNNWQHYGTAKDESMILMDGSATAAAACHLRAIFRLAKPEDDHPATPPWHCKAGSGSGSCDAKHCTCIASFFFFLTWTHILSHMLRIDHSELKITTANFL